MELRMLPASWRETAALFRDHADESVALAYERCADELERGLAENGSKLLTLREASRTSGYSADHLGRLIRDGKIRNAGRKNRPLIRTEELPTKPGYLPRMRSNRNLVGASVGQIVDAVVNSE